MLADRPGGQAPQPFNPRSTRGNLFPASLVAAHLHGLRVFLFPCGDGQRFVVAHFVVHAGAIGPDNRLCRPFTPVVPDAPVYPCLVISGLGKALTAGHDNREQRQTKYAHFHFKSPWK